MADPEGLLEVGYGEVVPLPTGEGSGKDAPSAEKKNFSIEMACFGVLRAVLFVRVLARKMLIFRLKW